MRRGFGGLLLLAHGLAHALPGTQAGAAGRSWLLTPLGIDSFLLRWIVALLSGAAIAGFVAAGFGVWGVPAFHHRWKRLAAVAAAASVALLLLFWLNAWAVAGLLIDLGVIAVLRRTHFAEGTPRPPSSERQGLRRYAAGLGHAGAVAFVAWLAIVSLTAPWHRFWGSSAVELAQSLPGDEPLDGPPTYWIQHTVTIDAPAARVWPWLAQLGTDRGGFYSYSLLERAFGIDVRNADRIHEEWQDLRAGDYVVATPAGYLGIDRPLGWNVTLVEAPRVMVLQYWGAFVLVPAGEEKTRFIVRTRNGQPPNLMGLTMSWFSLAFFEPAHFLMERQMLLGVKQRAESGWVAGSE